MTVLPALAVDVAANDELVGRQHQLLDNRRRVAEHQPAPAAQLTRALGIQRRAPVHGWHRFGGQHQAERVTGFETLRERAGDEQVGMVVQTPADSAR